MGSQLAPSVAEYLRELERSRHPVLLEMERIARDEEFPIIGPECGRALAVLSAAIEAKRVFEMGSGFGYSTLWFALAVGEGGEVVHTDSEETNSRRAQEFLARAGVEHRCRFLVGDAHELLLAETGPFDCILIDIEKSGYPKALEEAAPRLRPGGLLFAHNTLWSGRVADPFEADEATEGIRKFNQAVHNHPDFATFLNPVDDGLSISLRVRAPGQREALGL